MNEPKKICLSRIEIIEASFKLPNGGSLVLTQKNPFYITDDPDVIDFMSRQKGVCIGDIDDVEYRSYMSRRFSELPSAFRTDVKSEEAERCRWDTEDEKLAIGKLKELGYIVYKPVKDKCRRK